MRLADDRRGRIPFALVGVVLLVASATFSATLATRGPAVSDHSVEAAMEGTEAAALATLRSSVDDAASDAARNPVTAPVNASVGRVLNESGTFRDYLRIRVYLAARRHLPRAETHRGGVVASASLPATPTPGALRTAKRSVSIEAVDGGASIRATVRNVTLEARREGEVVASERTSVTVVVANPVLALHDRTATYERRLNAGPLDGPGLGRRLTARLYPVTWARGYAQHYGLPIANVLASRHVALSANGAALQLQRRTFGRADPDGWSDLRRATARTAARDAIEPLPVETPQVGGAGGGDAAASTAVRRNLTVGVNATADRAYLAVVANDGAGAVERALAASYTVDAGLETTVRTAVSGAKPPPARPGRNWSLAGERTGRSVTVTSTADLSPPAPKRGVVADRFSRRVTVEHTVTRRWRRGEAVTNTSASWIDSYRVGVAVVVDPPRGGAVPERPVRPAFEQGGALDGPNLADTPPRAVERLVDAQGGPDAVARRVALDESLNRTVEIEGDRPPALRRWVTEDLSSLRERVRNLTVNASTGAVGSGRANPPEALAERVGNRRATLLEAPETYDGAADRARVAARAAYLAAVIEHLDRRADATRSANDGLGSVLEDAGAGSPARVERIHDRAVASGEEQTSRSRSDGVRMIPDADPAYLSRSTVDGSEIIGAESDQSYYPLATRNVNLFTVPYGDAADTVLDGVFGRPNAVPLETAARSLVAANRTLRAADDERLARNRDRLSAEVRRSLLVVDERLMGTLARYAGLTHEEQTAAVADARARWSGLGRQGLATANGSFARAVTAEAAARAELDAADRDLLGVAVRDSVRRSLQVRGTWTPQPPTNRTATRTREVTRTALSNAVSTYGPDAVVRAKDRWIGEALGNVPAGLPVLPAPGYWYATTNVWTVTVEGSYGRFAVRTPRATSTPGLDETYVRDGDWVALDVDDDGRTERLGRDERVSFSVRTVVVVVVPPNGNGVGDVDGNADERSDGWSSAGP
jgi:hypothetical protein